MILYFSGTGNTRYVAGLLASRIGDSNVREFSAEELRQPDDASFDTNDECVIWAFPTYSWGIPPVVAEIMKRSAFGPGFLRARHYMVTTCGDDVGLIERQWRRIMSRRGIAVRYAYAVEMPNTYTLMKGFDVDSEEVAGRKLAQAPAAVDRIADALKNDKSGDILIRRKFSWFKSAVIYPWFIRHAMSPKPFHVDEGCNGCGTCARTCPMANIEVRDGRPQWGTACAGCLRCYHICPRHAVRYGSATEGKGQYICPVR